MVKKDKVDEKFEYLCEMLDKALSHPTDDHDLLIKLDTKFDSLKEDIKEIKDGTTKRIDDLDILTKKHEKKINNIYSYGAALLIILGIAETIAVIIFGTSD